MVILIAIGAIAAFAGLIVSARLKPDVHGDRSWLWFNREQWIGIGIVFGFFYALIALSCAAFYYDSVQRAAAFERVTGQHVEPSDAMFIELHVQAPAKEQP